VNKREDLKNMTDDIVFTEFKIDGLQVLRSMERRELSWARARSRRTNENKFFSVGNSSGRIHL
jgi:hypothetical protein